MPWVCPNCSTNNGETDATCFVCDTPRPGGARRAPLGGGTPPFGGGTPPSRGGGTPPSRGGGTPRVRTPINWQRILPIGIPALAALAALVLAILLFTAGNARSAYRLLGAVAASVAWGLEAPIYRHVSLTAYFLLHGKRRIARRLVLLVLLINAILGAAIGLSYLTAGAVIGGVAMLTAATLLGIEVYRYASYGIEFWVTLASFAASALSYIFSFLG